MDFQSRFVDQTDLYLPFLSNQDVVSDNLKFNNDTRLTVRAEQALPFRAWNKAGAYVELLADVTQNSKQEGLNSEFTYLYGEGALGRIELGNTYSAARTMGVNSARFARATGGIDGDYSEMLNTKLSDGLSALTNPAFFISAPRLPTDMFYGRSEKSTKVSYYSPKLSGFQFGISYTPDTSLRGTAAGFASSGTPGVATFDVDGNAQDVISPALQYQQDIGEFGVLLSAVGEVAPERSDNETTRDKLAAYALGANITYGDFVFGGSYGYWGSSLSLPGVDDTYYWDVGAGYQWNSLGFSLGYLNGDVGDGRYESQVVSAGLDYQLAPGLVPYLEANFFNLDSSNPANRAELSGNALFAGVKLSF